MSGKEDNNFDKLHFVIKLRFFSPTANIPVIYSFLVQIFCGKFALDQFLYTKYWYLFVLGFSF